MKFFRGKFIVFGILNSIRSRQANLSADKSSNRRPTAKPKRLVAMKFKQCELKFHPRHGFSVARSFWQRCDRSRTLLKFYSEPPSPRLNSIAQILPSAKAEDEPPSLCLNSAAPTDRRPAPGSVTSSLQDRLAASRPQTNSPPKQTI